MTDAFQLGTEKLDARKLLELLDRYQLIPQLVRGIVIDRAIQDIPFTQADLDTALNQFCQQNQLLNKDSVTAWLKQHGMTPQNLEAKLSRSVREERFKQQTWGSKVEQYFLTRKASLDQVIYSLIRTKDAGLAQEIYFRIKEGEQTFSELAQQYSDGPEASTGGILGPVLIGQPHPAVSRLLSVSQPGQLWAPRPLADWHIIVRLEKLIPAQLDDAMRRRLIDEMFETWVKSETQKIGALQLVPSLDAGSEAVTADPNPAVPEETQPDSASQLA